jgi:hypothetical protein
VHGRKRDIRSSKYTHDTEICLSFELPFILLRPLLVSRVLLLAQLVVVSRRCAWQRSSRPQIIFVLHTTDQHVPSASSTNVITYTNKKRVLLVKQPLIQTNLQFELPGRIFTYPNTPIPEHSVPLTSPIPRPEIETGMAHLMTGVLKMMVDTDVSIL